MKRIPLFFLLCIFLASCGTPAAPQPIVTFTPTLIPKTATPLPTNTPEPTSTPDPMKNAPIGADGVDIIGGKEVFYKLGTDGKTHNYDTGFKTPEGEIIWASSHIKNPTFKGGIPSYDEPGFGLEPGMRIDFQVKEGINAPYIQHETNKNFKGGLTYSVNFLDTMASRHFAMPYGKIGAQKVGEFNRDIFLAGKLAEPVWDAQGNPHTIYGDTSFKIILVDPTDIPNPDWETSNRSGPATNILSMAIFNDETHTVTIFVANTKPMEQLSDQEFVDTIFIPYGYALLLRYQSLEALKAHSDYYPNSDSLANSALKVIRHTLRFLNPHNFIADLFFYKFPLR